MLLLMIGVATPAWAGPDLRLIVDRRETSVEIFAAMDAERLPSILATDPDGLAASDGRIYLGALRETGTFDFGDHMLRGVRFSAGGEDAQLEAMSVMVHPDDQRLPFDTPLDGNIAMSVCGVDDPAEPPQISNLRLYSGFIAYPADGHAALRLTLPNSEMLEIEVVTFVDGSEESRATLELAPGEPIALTEASATWLETTWLARALPRSWLRR